MTHYSRVQLHVYHEIMRVMGLDVGDKTIGIAISDALLMTAQSRPTLRRSNLDLDMRHLRDLAAANDVHQVVVGNPLHMSGDESPQSQKVAQFARKLSKTLGLPVDLWDERLTSFAAEQHLEEMGLKWRQRRRHVDKIAAMLILQSYLDSRRS
jgi:putative holliday junction resolvase